MGLRKHLSSINSDVKIVSIRDLGYPLELSVMDICPHFCGMCPDVHGFSPGLICYRLVLPLLHRGRPLQIPPSSPNKKRTTSQGICPIGTFCDLWGIMLVRCKRDPADYE